MIIPETGRERLQAGIDRARMEKKRAEHARRRSAWTAVAAAAVVMIALPNTNMQIAHAMENIPLLGGFFRLVTVRQYNYNDENHDAEVELAQINYGEDAGEGASVGEVAAAPEGTAAGSVEGVGQEAAVANLSEDGVEAVNQDMEATVEELIRQFEDTLSEEGYHGLHVTQEVVTDNARYYTVKLSVLETEASGYEHNQFYTIDKQTGNVVTLEDLFAEGSDYISAISENIKTQMKEQMAADEGVIYFLDNDDMPEFNFQGITEQTNFYFNEKDELVIAFDEYEVAPGSMGAPEFVIPQEVTAAILK
ncbi:RsiV family protein [Waltera sp.]